MIQALATKAYITAAVCVRPDEAQAPGIGALKTLLNGLAAYAVVAAAAAVIVGGIAWAIGERTSLTGVNYAGRGAVMGGLGLALLVGFSNKVINWLLAAGTSVGC